MAITIIHKKKRPGHGWRTHLSRRALSTLANKVNLDTPPLTAAEELLAIKLFLHHKGATMCPPAFVAPSNACVDGGVPVGSIEGERARAHR
jgi:hypothetical protein